MHFKCNQKIDSFILFKLMKNFRGSALAAGVGTPESVPHELLGSSLRFYLVFKHRDCYDIPFFALISSIALSNYSSHACCSAQRLLPPASVMSKVRKPSDKSKKALFIKFFVVYPNFGYRSNNAPVTHSSKARNHVVSVKYLYFQRPRQ